METQTALDDGGINCPSSLMSLIDDIALDFEKSKARKEEEDNQKRKIEQSRQFIENTADGNETLPSSPLIQLRFLRQDFYQKLANAIEELTVLTLAAVLEADRQLQTWRRSMEAPSQSRYVPKVRVLNKAVPMPPVLRVNIEDRQTTFPVFLPGHCLSRRLAKRKLQEQRSDAIFSAQLKTVSAKQITEGKKTALEEALEKEKITDTEFSRLWLELQKPSRQLDQRYFYQGGAGFCEFARTRAVTKSKKDSKKKEKNKRKQIGKSR